MLPRGKGGPPKEVSTRDRMQDFYLQIQRYRFVIPAKAGTRGEHMDVFVFEERGIHLL